MRQCTLKNHNRYLTAWIPAEYAKVGMYLCLNEDNGWEVVAVYSYSPHVTRIHGYMFGGVHVRD